MGEGLQANPDELKRVWGTDLPRASDLYDAAIERMSRVATAYNRVQEPHVLESVESAWRHAIDDSHAVTDMLRGMQQTLLATADAVKAAMDNYVATDQAAAQRLGLAHIAAATTSGPPPLDPSVELDL
jgi:hypothetical protein